MSRTAAICLAAYLLGAALSFGHASNHCTVPTYERPWGTFEDTGAYGGKVLLATVFWPLYIAHLAFAPSAPIRLESQQ